MTRPRPNVLWFIADDTSHGMLGCYGGKALTPAIDTLAADGVRFSNFYCSASACMPSRYNYLTGRHASSCPAVSTTDGEEPANVWFNTPLNPDVEPCLAHAFQAAGYRTGFVGKWHLGARPEDLVAMPRLSAEEDPRLPDVNQRMQAHQQWLCDVVRRNGFDTAAAVVCGNHEHVPAAAGSHNLEWTTRAALDFLAQHGDGTQPFFLNVATTTIHAPDHAESLMADPSITAGGCSTRHLGCLPSRGSIYRRLRRTADMAFNSTTAGALWMDDVIGAIMARIRQLGLERDTIVVWSTDHGFSGGKFSVYESGLRIPFLMQWKGRLPAGACVDALAQSVDLAPTLLELAGIDSPPDMTIHGVSLAPLLFQVSTHTAVHDELYAEFGYTRALRRQRWKYIAWRPPRTFIRDLKQGTLRQLQTHFGRPLDARARRPTLMTPLILHMPAYFAADQLYDLKNDPHEQRNLAADPTFADILKTMRQRLRRCLDKLGTDFPLEADVSFHQSPRCRALETAARAALRQGENEFWRLAEIGGFDHIVRSFYGRGE